MSELKNIPLDQIAQNQVALRNVDRQSEKFLGLKDSIAKQGVLNAISVRPATAEGAEQPYELIDGLHRFIASMEAGRKDIPAQIMAKTDAEALEAQLIANVHKVETRPVEFARQIQRILANKPTLTVNALAGDLAMSPAWISERLGLLKLDPSIAELVDTDKIPLSNAYVLAKLPADEQKNFIQSATSEAPSEFVPRAQARIKEIRDAQRAGRTAGEVAFEPQARARKRTELVAELENPKMIPAIIKQGNIKDPIKAAHEAIKWALQLDDSSVEAGKAKFDQHRKELEAARAARKEASDAKKAKAGAEMAAAAGA